MKHYDANEYVADKRIALSKWQSLLFKIVGTSPGGARSNVAALPVRGGRAVSRRRRQIAA
jgi:hypothetical protein